MVEKKGEFANFFAGPLAKTDCLVYLWFIIL